MKYFVKVLSVLSNWSAQRNTEFDVKLDCFSAGVDVPTGLLRFHCLMLLGRVYSTFLDEVRVDLNMSV